MADQLISEHLRVVAFPVRTLGLSTAERSELQKAVARLGADGLDWQSAVQRELQVIRDQFPADA